MKSALSRNEIEILDRQVAALTSFPRSPLRLSLAWEKTMNWLLRRETRSRNLQNSPTASGGERPYRRLAPKNQIRKPRD